MCIDHAYTPPHEASLNEAEKILWLHRVEMKVLLEITFLRKINLKIFFAPKSRKGSIVRQIYKKS